MNKENYQLVYKLYGPKPDEIELVKIMMYEKILF